MSFTFPCDCRVHRGCSLCCKAHTVGAARKDGTLPGRAPFPGRHCRHQWWSRCICQSAPLCQRDPRGASQPSLSINRYRCSQLFVKPCSCSHIRTHQVLEQLIGLHVAASHYAGGSLQLIPALLSKLQSTHTPCGGSGGEVSWNRVGAWAAAARSEAVSIAYKWRPAWAVLASYAPVAVRLHLALFYFYGVYYHWAKRATGVPRLHPISHMYLPARHPISHLNQISHSSSE